MLSKPIPPKLRKEMEEDLFYSRCCVTGISNRNTKIDWHHNLIFAGERVNEKWAILPIAKRIHDKADVRQVKEILDWIMLNRGADEDLRRFSKAEDLIKKRERLNKVYGPYQKNGGGIRRNSTQTPK